MLPVLVMWMSGCPVKPITQVSLDGVVFDGPDSIDGVGSGTVDVRSFDGTLFDSTVTDSTGRFTVTAPAGQPAFMIVSGPDHIPTSFTVNIGTVDVFVPDQAIWARRATVHDALAAEFDACGAATVPLPSLEGEVRLYLGQIDDPGSEPLVTSAVAEVQSNDGSMADSCYLDEDGVSTSSATVTGTTGRYAIFDAPVGPGVLTVTYDSSDMSTTTEVLVYVPEGGTVPGYPTYVALP
jgi:hypothetical protein